MSSRKIAAVGSTRTLSASDGNPGAGLESGSTTAGRLHPAPPPQATSCLMARTIKPIVAAKAALSDPLVPQVMAPSSSARLNARVT